MKRRTLIKNGLVLSSGILIPSLSMAQTSAGSEKPPIGDRAPVVQVTGESPHAITRKAVEALGGMRKFVSRGDVVMIKPNIGWNKPVEMAATTNPEVIRALVEMTLDAGAKKVIVMDHTLSKAEDAYRSSGIEAAAKKAGAEVRYTDDNRLVEHDFKGEYIQKWPVYRDFLDIDKFINVPILKHHGSSALSIAMKNLYGILGGNRGKLHRDMGYNIADMAAGFKNHLVVIDAYRVLLRNGPIGGRLSDVEMKKTVIASTRIVEADAIAAVLFGAAAADVEFLRAASENGLGEIDPAKIFLKTIRG